MNNSSKSQRPPCPACGGVGRKVAAATLQSLLRDPPEQAEGFRFCKTPGCDVVYYAQTERDDRYATADLRVPVFQKSEAADRPVCYCFSHTVRDIEREVEATGGSTIPDEISEKCRAGLDRCEEENPQGSCCLGNVRKVAEDAIAANGLDVPAGVETRDDERAAGDCCAAPSAAVSARGEARSDGAGVTASPQRNAGAWSAGGAVLAAVLSSACCWLPLVLVGAGVSAAGVAGFFETYRWVFLGATGLLLAGGFYFVYFRRPKCAPGDACEKPRPRLRRVNQVMLWIATVFVVAFAAFPNYVGAIFGGAASSSAPAKGSDVCALSSRTFAISGMTCAGCTAHVRTALAKIAGVRRVEVSYARKQARVWFDAAKAPDDRAIIAAVSKLGYRATRADAPRAALD